MKNCLVAFTMLLTAVSLHAELVVYPDYPERISRDEAYRVTVTQGRETRPLTVWNRTEKSILKSRTPGGDVNRRFCEFAFSGDPVRVDIRVRRDVDVYAVFPSRLGLKNSFKDGVISVWLDRPAYFGIRLNDLDKTILSVFADAPEDPARVPKPKDPGVLYVSRWTDAPGRGGQIVVSNNVRQVYIAPGAVLNARLTVLGNDTLVNGRGMLLDPLSDIFRYDQLQAKTRGLLVMRGKNVTVRDIKLIDARTFNLITSGRGGRIFNTKVLSAMMCSDGITVGGADIICANNWLYVGDNALVVSGVKGCFLHDIVIGTSCAAVFPQGSFTIPARLENIDVFRADDGLINNWYNGLVRKVKWNELKTDVADRRTTGLPPTERRHQTITMAFRNLCAVDCVRLARIFNGRNMGTLPKHLSFLNVSAPASTGSADYRTAPRKGGAISVTNSKDKLFTSNYTLAFTNLTIAGKAVTQLTSEIVSGGTNLTVTCARAPGGVDGVPAQPCRHTVSYVCPLKIFIGDALQTPAEEPFRKNGEIYMPVSLFEKAGATPPPGAGRFVPLSVFCRTVPAVFDAAADAVRVTCLPSNENLVAETWPNQSVWQRIPSWMVKLDALETEDGARVYRLTQVERKAGMQAIVTDGVLRHGSGRYRLSFEARTGAAESVVLIGQLVSNEWTVMAQPVTISDTKWTPYTREIDVVLQPGTDLAGLSLTVAAPSAEFSLRRLSFAKIN